VLQITCPAQTISVAGGPPSEARAATVIRILGARQLLQAFATGLRPTSSVLAAGAAVDGVHATTMVALALRKREWRRAALQEALVASCLALAGAGAARSR
jgi:hypothetical protein